MKTLMLLTFGILGWTFYTMSGGADYVPKDGSRQAIALAKAQAESTRMASFVQTPVETPANAAPDEASNPPAQTFSADLGIAPNMLVISQQVSDSLQPPARTAEADLPNARIASLTLAEPAAFAQAAGYAPESDIQTDATIQTDTTETAAVQPSDDLRRITGNRVNIRMGPGTSYGVTGQVTRGSEVEVLDALPSGWLQLRVRDSQQIGWVATSLVSGSEG